MNRTNSNVLAAPCKNMDNEKIIIKIRFSIILWKFDPVLINCAVKWKLIITYRYYHQLRPEPTDQLLYTFQNKHIQWNSKRQVQVVVNICYLYIAISILSWIMWQLINGGGWCVEAHRVSNLLLHDTRLTCQDLLQWTLWMWRQPFVAQLNACESEPLSMI